MLIIKLKKKFYFQCIKTCLWLLVSFCDKEKNYVFYLACTQWSNYVKDMTKVEAFASNKVNSTIINLFSNIYQIINASFIFRIC